MPKIVCVVPTIRPVQMESFKKAWTPLFEKHNVTLITVWDGEEPRLEASGPLGIECGSLLFGKDRDAPLGDNRNLFCRFTDACRNLGFVSAAQLDSDYVMTLDDDVTPVTKEYLNDHSFLLHDWCDEEVVEILDPIQMHLNTLSLRVSLSWMNTAHSDGAYLRGMPYTTRNESPVMLSHGVWVGVPDFDGETQLLLEQGGEIPKSLPYYVGPIPKGVLFPLCGMNVMIRREALPYLYFAPMGPDAGVSEVCPKCFGNGFINVPSQTHRGEAVLGKSSLCNTCNANGQVYPLNRFADIWMGIFLKRKFDELGWACYTGGSVVHHTRASDAKKNMEQEKLSREWNEKIWQVVHPVVPIYGDPMGEYLMSYENKRVRYERLIKDILRKG